MDSTPISLTPSSPFQIPDGEFLTLQTKANSLTYLFLTLDELSRMRTARIERGLDEDHMLDWSIMAQSAGRQELKRVRHRREMSGTWREVPDVWR